MHITTSLLKPYPLLAIGLLSHMYSRSLKKERNTTSIKEMNSTCKRNRKENGLAFIASRLSESSVKAISAFRKQKSAHGGGAQHCSSRFTFLKITDRVDLFFWNFITFFLFTNQPVRLHSFGSAGKESVCNVGHLILVPGLGRSPAEGKGYPLQYSGLQNSMDYTVHGVANSWT